jgi:hypothetical protein
MIEKRGSDLARQRAKQMDSRMDAMFQLTEEEFIKALRRLGLKPGEPRYERAMVIWREQQ